MRYFTKSIDKKIEYFYNEGLNAANDLLNIAGNKRFICSRDGPSFSDFVNKYKVAERNYISLTGDSSFPKEISDVFKEASAKDRDSRRL